MDLRSVLNNSDAGERGRERERDRDRERTTPKQPPTPQQQPHQLPQHHQQSPASYPYRDYGHPSSQVHQSPGKPAHQDYPPHGSHQSQPSSYVPPQSPYQQPSPYPGRPAPPPLQPTNSFHDARSPSGSMPAPSPTAYRASATPSAAPPGAPAGYPFPSQESTSPSMRHQHPPAPYQPNQPQRHDSYSYGSGPYPQQPGHASQASPVATPVSGHPYPPQRSQSTHSTPTPTSAHSQHQFPQSFSQGSPVAAHQPHPAEYQRQPSQPPTPHGASSAAQRQHIGHPGYPQQQQPPSPYQQRVHSIPGHQTHSPQQPQHQPYPGVKREPSTNDKHESLLAQHPPLPLAHLDRENSLSVSPKTVAPSLPNSSDRKSVSTEREYRPAQVTDPMAIDSDRAVTPAKRKLEDRDLSPRELEHKEGRPPPGEVNGTHVPALGNVARVKSESPEVRRKTRVRHKAIPVWAQKVSLLGNKLPKNPNFVLQHRIHSHINGGQAEAVSEPRHETPEKAKTQAAQAAQAAQPPPPVAEPASSDILGPWEASITSLRPYEELSRTIADFLFVHVVNSEDMSEIQSRGIQFEIEAKLGTLIDKDTNQRVHRGIESEAILQDTGRIAFRSSMTEAHHKSFNDYLNQVVVQTHPKSGNNRVQLQYKHRREIDRFIELPTELQQRIPGCMRSRLGSRARNVRVRLTYDQKTQEVLGKIIKARVADIDIHMPTCPMDCRISINLEMDYDGSVQELEQLAASQTDRQPDRNKDRLSYTHGHYQIDLTQVTQQHHGPGNAARTEKEHELEIELAPGILIDQGRKALSGGDHRYQELVEGLVDNIRVLARKARDYE